MLRRFLTCLAFATWCFADTWIDYAESRVVYFARHPPITAVVLPIACLEILIAVTMFGAWEFFRRRGLASDPWLHFVFLGMCLAPLGIVSVAALRASPFDLTQLIRERWFWPVVLAVTAGPAIFICLRARAASLLMRSVFFYSCPVLLLILVQSARVTWLRYPGSAYADGPLAPAFDRPPSGPRVVWIIFDELSQTIAFGHRPAGLELPEFDRLKASSFYASAAEPPAMFTEISLPSLILGEQVREANPVAPSNLQLSMASGGAPVAWSTQPNVFDSAREMGLNTAIAGWFHPYGRLLNRSLTECYWVSPWLSPGVEEEFRDQPLPVAMWDHIRFQFVALPLVGHLPGVIPWAYQREGRIERFLWLQDRAIEVVSDPSIGLALIHLPVPHPPSIYSRDSKQLTARGNNGYIDSVALADRTFGRIRQALEQSGLWDRTAVLVSADHGWRTNMWRGTPEWTAEEEANSHQDTSGVPFLLKLPGQKEGATYDKRFNTLVTRQVITSILKGGLTDPGEIPALLERNAASK